MREVQSKVPRLYPHNDGWAVIILITWWLMNTLIALCELPWMLQPATVVICASPRVLQEKGPVVRRGTQCLRPHLAALAAALTTAADWLWPIDHTINVRRTGHEICRCLIDSLITHYALITDLTTFLIFINNLVMRCLRGKFDIYYHYSIISLIVFVKAINLFAKQ